MGAVGAVCTLHTACVSPPSKQLHTHSEMKALTVLLLCLLVLTVTSRRDSFDDNKPFSKFIIRRSNCIQHFYILLLLLYSLDARTLDEDLRVESICVLTLYRSIAS